MEKQPSSHLTYLRHSTWLSVQLWYNSLDNIFGVDDEALKWTKLYLTGRHQFIKISSTTSQLTPCNCVWSTTRFDSGLDLVYVLHITNSKVTAADDVAHQQYATDTQLHVIVSKILHATATHNLGDCVVTFCRWFAENGLNLNPDQPEAMLLLTSQRTKRVFNL